MVQTFTFTTTFTRFSLMSFQIRTVLRRTTNIEDRMLNKLILGAEKRWIKKYSIYAFDNKKLCKGELNFEIDWNEYNYQISIGKTTVSIDRKNKKNVIIEVDEAVRAFNDFVRELKLNTEYRVVYSDFVYNDLELLESVREKLSLAAADKIKWAKKHTGKKYILQELPECSIGLYLIDE